MILPRALSSVCDLDLYTIEVLEHYQTKMNLILSLLSIFPLFVTTVCGSSSFFSAVNTEAQPEMICVPNATFHIDCNKCICSSNGMSISCTEWICETVGIAFDHLMNVSVSCRPGELLLIEDLKCVCSSSGGRAVCSSARLELAHDLQLRADTPETPKMTDTNCDTKTAKRRGRANKSRVHVGKLSTRQCSAPGIIYRPRDNPCDTCICPDGNSGGSQPACLGITVCPERSQMRTRPTSASHTGSNEFELSRDRIKIRSTEMVCVPSSTFSINCNQCLCDEDGLSMSCDQYPCLGVEIRDDQMLNIGFRCESGGSFVYNRHSCVCSISGDRALCSLLDLPTRIDEDEQQEQPVTPSISSEFIEAKNGSVLSLAEFPELCTPGTLFKRWCNVCLCGSRQWAACTSLDCRLVYGRANIDTWMRGSDAVDDDGNEVEHRQKSSEALVAAPTVFKEDMWIQRRRSLVFCRQNEGSKYCRYLRDHL